jgi:hypothetical protein
MPETKSGALARAKREGFPKSSVVKSSGGAYFIAPHGITSNAAKKAYADLRSKGNSQEKSAKIAWSIEKNKRG